MKVPMNYDTNILIIIKDDVCFNMELLDLFINYTAIYKIITLIDVKKSLRLIKKSNWTDIP